MKTNCITIIAGLGLVVGAFGCGPGEEDDAGNGEAVVVVDQNNNTNNATTPEPSNASTPSNTTTVTDNTDPGNSTTPPNNSTSGGMCVDVAVYADADGDGFGVEAGETSACLLPDESPAMGLARTTGDCRDSDPLAFEGAEGVCGDNVDDNCDGMDEACPASQPDDMNVPAWDCTGDAPSNVYAWARFDDGGEYFKPGGCFVIFEGAKGLFYSQRVGVEPQQECAGRYGCVCPSLGGWESFDRRLYAMTVSGVPGECDEIALTDHAGESQPVSNDCRKYLYQLHRYDIPYSFFAGSLESLERRMENYPTVEIACLEDAPHRNLPFASLLTTEFVQNDEYQPL